MEVAERRAAVLARWSRLKSSLGAWRGKLGQSQSFQQFKREADEAEMWVGEKMQVACDDSYKDPTDLPVSPVGCTQGVKSVGQGLNLYFISNYVHIHVQGKLQKHQAFDAEVVANKERIFSAIAMGQSKHYSLPSWNTLTSSSPSLPCLSSSDKRP